MSYTCPISFEKIDSNVSRISAMIVATFVVTYLATSNVYILYILFFDFYMKLFCQKKFSIITQFSKAVKIIFRLKDKFSDSGAKRLAGYFGMFFILLLITGAHLNLHFFSMVVGAIFLACSLLDAFFNYCFGCKIYFIIKKIDPNFMS